MVSAGGIGGGQHRASADCGRGVTAGPAAAPGRGTDRRRGEPQGRGEA